MRSEQEMLQLIREFVNRDERIRAAVLNGSRANPNARKDPFQDFDVACLVSDVTPYIANPEIIRFFGETIIVQEPESMGDPSPAKEGWYSYLMQFTDGNRIDLSFHPPERWAHVTGDSLTVVLVDKDDILGHVPPASETSYLPKPPTEKQFQDCCNEFWWVNPYAAKGLWRGELIYPKTMLEEVLREQLMKMLTWYFGLRFDFQRPAGKLGKHFKAGLGEEIWREIQQTYADADAEHTWQALFAMNDLFRKLALQVAATFHFEYPQQDDERVSAYIRQIKNLSPGATEI